MATNTITMTTAMIAQMSLPGMRSSRAYCIAASAAEIVPEVWLSLQSCRLFKSHTLTIMLRKAVTIKRAHSRPSCELFENC